MKLGVALSVVEGVGICKVGGGVLLDCLKGCGIPLPLVGGGVERFFGRRIHESVNMRDLLISLFLSICSGIVRRPVFNLLTPPNQIPSVSSTKTFGASPSTMICQISASNDA